MSDRISEAVSRFNAVFAARVTFMERVMLFEQLKSSTKFAEDCKPFCLYRLLQLFIEQPMSPEQMLNLLVRLPEQNVMASLRAELDEESVDTLRAQLARKVLNAERPSPRAVALMQAAIRAEIAGSRGELFSLALGANMPYADVDAMADATFEEWQKATST